jgi:hypothetical protein
VVWRTAGQSDGEEFATALANKIAGKLNTSAHSETERSSSKSAGPSSSPVVATSYTGSDRDEFVKRLMFQTISRPTAQRPSARAVLASYPPEIVAMAERVKEVVPAVPLNVIAADLGKYGKFLVFHVKALSFIPITTHHSSAKEEVFWSVVTSSFA